MPNETWQPDWPAVAIAALIALICAGSYAWDWIKRDHAPTTRQTLDNFGDYWEEHHGSGRAA